MWVVWTLILTVHGVAKGDQLNCGLHWPGTCPTETVFSLGAVQTQVMVAHADEILEDGVTNIRLFDYYDYLLGNDDFF